MNKLRIGLDIDDTIAGFSQGYIERFGKFPKVDWAITRNVNNILIKEREFWLGLPLLRKPDFEPRLYCSCRINNKRWTKQYLNDRGLPKSPLYQIPGYHLSKAETIRGKVDVFIDDSVRIFEDLNKKGIPCLLIDSVQNKNYETPYRIYSLKYAEIEGVYNKLLTDKNLE
jgi:uncharacterized HAD superfamily protein